MRRSLRIWWQQKGTGMSELPPANVDTLRQLAGQWVAIRDGRILTAKDTFDQVYHHLHERQERGTTILRIPADEEPELVGFG
jgi:hypothetical protein